MKKALIFSVAILLLIACEQRKTNTSETTDSTTTTQTDTTLQAIDPAKVTMDGELPSKAAVSALFNEMDYQQATQCYLWGLPIVAYAEWQHIHNDVFGASSNDLVMYNSYDDKLGILTANATTPYIINFIDLAKNGPTVIEMPAGHTAGGLGDFWQRELAAIGELGADKGKGGKYILTPPGRKPITAPGYYSIPSSMMNVFFGFRALDPDPAKAMALIKGVKIYPYADRANPKPTKLVSPAGKKYLAIQPDGLVYWQRLYDILNEEPVEERDRFFMSWLNNLGIIKGKPFNPTERQKKILIAAATRGKQMAMANSFDKRLDSIYHWQGRKWDYVMALTNSNQRAANYDEFFRRTSYFFEAVTFSNAMISKTPNLGQAYLGAYEDKDGNWLEGNNSYTLHIPANPPAVNFWSVTIYDAATRCIIDNKQRNADLSSRKDLVKNSDGSIDLYFAPEAPAGKEKNWVQTNPGKHWFAYMRFYGPTIAYFDKSWKMDDIVKVK
ncbi:DUF1254 domain-containing protein [Mucilaginibacter jinjuensis]|uniref:DUF1254 domain-containing protein n=1 Tax=Mucilaginibacter jinjuensis TaxID=1176721 RepID=A0ABY7T7F5_9SPHI|nr:DUF1254 domain-containing protein [Mucilaginibacter jinjuensis]WCT12281.1 DUF1254 domain-containing protein [Mucilaginibacter jinjuensis]